MVRLKHVLIQVFSLIVFFVAAFAITKLPEAQRMNGMLVLGLVGAIPGLLTVYKMLSKTLKAEAVASSAATPITEFENECLTEFTATKIDEATLRNWAEERGYTENVASTQERRLFQKGGRLSLQVVICLESRPNGYRLSAWGKPPNARPMAITGGFTLAIPVRIARKDVNKLLAIFGQPPIFT